MSPPPVPCPRFRLNLVMPAVLLLFCAEARPAQWTIVPSIGLREAYTDNVALTPSPRASSDWVTELVPGITAAAVGPRFRFSGSYGLHLLDYRRSGSNDALNNGSLTANGELVKDWLFIDAAASVTQQNISGFGPQSVDLINDTANRTEVRNVQVSPYLRRQFGSFAIGEARYTAQSIRTTSGDLLNADAHRVTVDVSSGSEFARWGWDVLLDRQKIDYLNAFPLEFNRYTAKLRYAITPRLAAHIIGGHEDNDYPALGAEGNGRVWAGAVTWAPSENTIVSGSAGHRFFGRTFNLLASRRTQRSAFTLGYSEDVTTLAGIGSTGTFDTVRMLSALANANAPTIQNLPPGFSQSGPNPYGSAGTLAMPVPQSQAQRAQRQDQLPILAPGSDAAIAEAAAATAGGAQRPSAAPQAAGADQRRIMPSDSGPAGLARGESAGDTRGDRLDAAGGETAGETLPAPGLPRTSATPSRPTATPARPVRQPVRPSAYQDRAMAAEAGIAGEAAAGEAARVAAPPEAGPPGTIPVPAFAGQAAVPVPPGWGNPIAPIIPQAAAALASSTAQQNLLDPFARNTGLPGGLGGFSYGLSNRVYLQKLLQATFELTGARNNMMVRLFATRREPLSIASTPVAPPPTALPFQDDNSRQAGVNLSLTHHLSPRTHLNLGVNYARLHSYLDGRTDRDGSVRIALARRLRDKVSASIEFRRQQRSSSMSDVDYKENAVIAFLFIQL
ncbi:TIGR03016 family PEP-CTERM system-associated outer membrane protein [Lacisediminimonas profundi]|uniref:TIGR03016 family PEP-CTERM system-associated outer membrane protein n=1 Tax=Lacisediminimonas profundi TaxID=2603856 RepID=UPI00124BAC98|nr:TIGR03016 family PEP-CTERM system-associated outer membrane protein [Lacisediminimonas profundi]